MARTPGRKQAAPRKKTPDENGMVTHVRYSKAVCEKICTRIAGGEAWSKIANTGDLPSYATIYDWMKRYPDFKEAYEEAREMAADRKADKALEVAEATTPSTVSADRLKVATLHWQAARDNPRRYGRKAEDRVKEEPTVTFYIRHFEKVVDEDGRTYVREIPRAPKRRRRAGP
ncbi:hypothetical protein [Phenylobacterium sp.]|uniref:terminase small subunit-like protein n=1 Tax=Phenylobacterium sp. TaxID=1871053 RepID=UPI003919DFC0